MRHAAVYFWKHVTASTYWIGMSLSAFCLCRNEKVPAKELTNLVTTLEAIPAPAPAPLVSLPGGMQAAPILAPAPVPSEPTAHCLGNVQARSMYTARIRPDSCIAYLDLLILTVSLQLASVLLARCLISLVWLDDI